MPKALTEQQLRDRQIAYRLVFATEGEREQAVLAVFKDLREFCRSEESTFHADARVHAALEGRREVWLRIQQHLTLSLEDLILTKTPKGHS